MKGMIMWGLLRVLLVTSGLLVPVISWGQGLPEGPGRDAVITGCTACHGLDNILQPHKKLTAVEWETYVYDMVARGAPVNKEDIEPIKQYLIKHFAVN